MLSSRRMAIIPANPVIYVPDWWNFFLDILFFKKKKKEKNDLWFEFHHTENPPDIDLSKVWSGGRGTLSVRSCDAYKTATVTNPPEADRSAPSWCPLPRRPEGGGHTPAPWASHTASPPGRPIGGIDSRWPCGRASHATQATQGRTPPGAAPTYAPLTGGLDYAPGSFARVAGPPM